MTHWLRLRKPLAAALVPYMRSATESVKNGNFRAAGHAFKIASQMCFAAADESDRQ